MDVILICKHTMYSSANMYVTMYVFITYKYTGVFIVSIQTGRMFYGRIVCLFIFTLVVVLVVYKIFTTK